MNFGPQNPAMSYVQSQTSTSMLDSHHGGLQNGGLFSKD